MAAAPPPLPVTVVGGYLGAGKTTLVNHLLRHAAGRRIAVAVNEFGALPIDSDLIEGADGNVLTLSGGCICCTFGSDLVAGLIDLSQRAATLDHIVIEASGVALPGAIAQSLSLVAGVTLDAVVVVVDAETVRARASDLYMGDTIARQLADADLVVVNKCDLVSETHLRAVLDWLPAMAPAARLVTTTQAVVPVDVLLRSGTPTAFDSARSQAPHLLSAFAQDSYAFDHAVDAAGLADALADPALGLIRAKGFVRDVSRGWLTLQVVARRTALSPAPATGDGHSRLVCIAQGRRFDRQRIADLLATFGQNQDDIG